jgi:hypothetical protein
MSDPENTENTENTETYPAEDAVIERAAPGRSFRAGMHPVNVGHLVMGVAFAGLTVIWALFVADLVHGHDLRWLLPIPWVAAGVAGLVATAPRLRGRSPEAGQLR